MAPSLTSHQDIALLGLKMSQPEVVALVGYIALIIIVLLPFDMYTYNVNEKKYIRVPYNFAYRLLIALLLMLPFFLGVYSINCIHGHCHAWSWIVAILTIVWAFTIAIVTISMGSFTIDQLV